jgi:hypothetical protein
VILLVMVRLLDWAGPFLLPLPFLPLLPPLHTSSSRAFSLLLEDWWPRALLCGWFAGLLVIYL